MIIGDVPLRRLSWKWTEKLLEFSLQRKRRALQREADRNLEDSSSAGRNTLLPRLPEKNLVAIQTWASIGAQNVKAVRTRKMEAGRVAMKILPWASESVDQHRESSTNLARELCKLAQIKSVSELIEEINRTYPETRSRVILKRDRCCAHPREKRTC